MLFRTTRRTLGLALVALMLVLTGCSSGHGHTTSNTYAPPSPQSSLPGPRPTELQAKPVVNPCLFSPAEAQQLTNDRRLFIGDGSPYYLRRKLLSPGEIPYWVCHYEQHLARPIEGLSVLTYDTTSVAAAQRKYSQLSRTLYADGGSQYARVQQPTSYVSGAQHSFLLTCSTIYYCAIGVLTGKTVMVIFWDEAPTKPGIFKRLAEAAIVRIPAASK